MKFYLCMEERIPAPRGGTVHLPQEMDPSDLHRPMGSMAGGGDAQVPQIGSHSPDPDSGDPAGDQPSLVLANIFS